MLRQTQNAIVRHAIPSDAGDIERVHRTSWFEAYRAIIPHQDLSAMVASHPKGYWKSVITRGDTVLILDFQGTIAGYATVGRTRRPHRNRIWYGAIHELYLQPDFQGLGFGELLFEGCRNVIDEWGLPGPIVWVLADNHRARRFYHARGGRITGAAHHQHLSTRLHKLELEWD